MLRQECLNSYCVVRTTLHGTQRIRAEPAEHGGKKCRLSVTTQLIFCWCRGWVSAKRKHRTTVNCPMFSGGEKTLSLVTIGKIICISLAKLYHTSYNFIHQIAIYVQNFQKILGHAGYLLLKIRNVSTLRRHKAYPFFGHPPPKHH